MTARDPFKYFRIEARELLEKLDQALPELAIESPDARSLALSKMSHAAHTLKGAAYAVVRPSVVEQSRAMETILATIRESAGPARHEQIEGLRHACERVQLDVASLEPGT